MAPIGHTAENIAAALAEFRANLSAAGDLTPPGSDAPPSDDPKLQVSSKVGALSQGAHQPSLSSAEAASAREAWIAAGLSAEKFDAALSADGISIPVTDDPRVVKAHEAHNLPVNPKASDYMEFAQPIRDWAPQAGTLSEMASFAADMGFSKELGRGVPRKSLRRRGSRKRRRSVQ